MVGCSRRGFPRIASCSGSRGRLVQCPLAFLPAGLACPNLHPTNSSKTYTGTFASQPLPGPSQKQSSPLYSWGSLLSRMLNSRKVLGSIKKTRQWHTQVAVCKTPPAFAPSSPAYALRLVPREGGQHQPARGPQSTAAAGRVPASSVGRQPPAL